MNDEIRVQIDLPEIEDPVFRAHFKALCHIVGEGIGHAIAQKCLYTETFFPKTSQLELFYLKTLLEETGSKVNYKIDAESHGRMNIDFSKDIMYSNYLQFNEE